MAVEFRNASWWTDRNLKILSVKDPNWIRPVAIAYRKDAYLSPAALRLIEIIKATAKEIAAD